MSHHHPLGASSPAAQPSVVDLRRRDAETARRLRDAVGDSGDLRGRLALDGAKCLLVASSGGHIAQLAWLLSSVPVHEDSTFMTFRTPQTEALLAGRRVIWLDYVPPRGYRELLPVGRRIVAHLAGEHYDVALSTGASIAVPALLAQAARGARAVYVESISRVDGPSQTGRVLARVPGIERYTQHEGWSGRRWEWAGSVLDGLASPRPHVGREVRDVLVTLGTIRPYRFDRLVDRVLAVLPSDVNVTWQLGCTHRTDLPGMVHEHLPAHQMAHLIATSDLVISHAGVATALQLAACGTPSILVPRRAAHHEHVDDHQRQIARLFAGAGLTQVVEADRLQRQHLAPRATFARDAAPAAG